MFEKSIMKKLKFDSSKANLIVNAPVEFIANLTGEQFVQTPSKKDIGKYDFDLVFGKTSDKFKKNPERYCPSR